MVKRIECTVISSVPLHTPPQQAQSDSPLDPAGAGLCSDLADDGPKNNNGLYKNRKPVPQGLVLDFMA